MHRIFGVDRGLEMIRGLFPHEFIISKSLSTVNEIIPFTPNTGWHIQETKNKTKDSLTWDQQKNFIRLNIFCV